MRKLKLISCIIILCVLTFGFLSIKKTNALEIDSLSYIISERDQTQYNFVCAYDFSTSLNDPNINNFNFLALNSYNDYVRYYFNIDSNNILKFYSSINGNLTLLESENVNGRLLQFNIVYDVDSLYVIVYKLLPIIQTSQGLPPSFNGFTRSMVFRHSLSHYYDLTNDWSDNNIKIYPCYDAQSRTLNGLYNCAYVSATDTINDINNWIDKQFSNSNIINYILNQGFNEGYNQGYDSGYNQGVSDGEDVGYENGYSDGYDSGYSDGTIDGEESGYLDGYNVGYDAGYLVGYDDGTQGETIFSPFFAIMQQIFGAIGQFLAIEIAPHLPLGIFVFVPLFFGVVGLILWIWRRN